MKRKAKAKNGTVTETTIWLGNYGKLVGMVVERKPRRKTRKAFTLIELLVVIGIILLLTTIVVAIFKTGAGSDRMRSGARTAQSAFRGAVDRAVKAKQNRGIRFVLDQQDSTLVTGFQYVWPMEPQAYGMAYQSPIRIVRRDEDGTPGPDNPYAMSVQGIGTNWMSLQADGLLADPPRVKIGDSYGRYYGILRVWAAPSGSPEYLDLTGPYQGDVIPYPSGLAVDVASSQATCLLELRPGPLPEHQPILMPSGVVIDLDWSSPSMAAAPDVMFTPRGSVDGALAARGPLYLLLNDIQDATRGLNPIDPANVGEKLILAVFPQTGNVASFPIDPTDADGDSMADDLYKYAKIGSEAGR